MAREKSPAEYLLDACLMQAVHSILKPHGFRKKERNYHRRHGETVQVLNVQISTSSNWEEKIFYVNVGIAFDAICRLTDQPILEQPKEYECDSRGTRDRLQSLVPGTPGEWRIKAGEDPTPTTRSLGQAVQRLLVDLQSISSPQAYNIHPWFSRFRPKRENAQVFYLLGDFDQAWKEVEDLAALFTDRESANRIEWWVKKLGLRDLEDRLGNEPRV
jgi:Domain of unknown function (DUF4304)